jgi:hypothetical protein
MSSAALLLLILLAFLVGVLTILYLRRLIRLPRFLQGKAGSPVVVDRLIIIHQIRQLNQITTSVFTEKDVFSIESHPHANKLWKWLRNDHILLTVQGNVIAGIDFNKLRAEDIVLHGTAIRLTLPAPEIFWTNLDDDKTQVHSRRSGIFARWSEGYLAFEQNAKKDARKMLREAALKAGILEHAANNARQLEYRLCWRKGLAAKAVFW